MRRYLCLLMAWLGAWVGSAGGGTLRGAGTQTVFRIDTVAGSDNVGDGGAARLAQISTVQGLALDRAGNLYFTDTDHHRVRKISASGIVTTLAGNGHPGYSGDGAAASGAQVNLPYGIAVDDAGNVYFADYGNSRVRRISPGGIITTVAGTGRRASTGDGGPATQASLMGPRNVAIDATGIYISEFDGHRVRRVSPDGRIVTVAGTGEAGFRGDGGPAPAAHLAYPAGLAATGGGLLYVADSRNHRVRRIDPAGYIQTVLGGTESTALLSPVAVAVDRAGTVYVGDASATVRRFTPNGWWSTAAGTGVAGFSGDGGPALAARLADVRDLAVDYSFNLYIADGPRVRRVGTTSIITTLAGDNYLTAIGDGTAATSGILNRPAGVAFDAAGNLYIADSGTHRIRVAAPTGTLLTAAGSGAAGFAGDPITASAAALNAPSGVAVDGQGYVAFADTKNHRVRRLGADGMVYTAAGTGVAGASAGGLLPEATALTSPRGVCASTLALYVVDTGNHRVLRVPRTGVVTVVAGDGTAGYSGNGGAGTAARLNTPLACAADAAGNLYIADTGNHAVRKLTAAGIISTVAGSGAEGYSGDGGAAVGARLSSPAGVAADPAGNLYIADTGNHRIRAVDAQGVIRTIAGAGTAGFSGDGGAALEAQLDSPSGLALDAAGALYAADTGNHRIRRLAPQAAIADPVSEAPAYTLLHAASRQQGPVAPGQLAILRGGRLGPETAVAGRADAGRIETSAGGCEVRFQGTPAPLLSVQAAEILLQVPYEVAGKDEVEIEVRCNGSSSGAFTAAVTGARPALFATVTHEDGSINAAENPAARGSVVTFLATGEGLNDAGSITGKMATDPPPHPALPVSLAIAGVSADLLYAGAAPGMVGVLQINARVPAGFVTAGKTEAVLTVGWAVSPALPVYLR